MVSNKTFAVKGQPFEIMCDMMGETSVGVLFNEYQIGTCNILACLQTNGERFAIYKNGSVLFTIIRNFDSSYCGMYACRTSASAITLNSFEVLISSK